MQLLSIANRYDVPIIEEASERDFNYTDNKIPSLYAMDKNQSVVYINSFTLTFPYDIKIAYIVGPHDLMEMLGRYVMITETTISSLTDYVMNEILESGYYEKCVNKLVCELKSGAIYCTPSWRRSAIRGSSADVRMAASPSGAPWIRTSRRCSWWRRRGKRAHHHAGVRVLSLWRSGLRAPASGLFQLQRRADHQRGQDPERGHRCMSIQPEITESRGNLR